jgi:hypothetical protein
LSIVGIGAIGLTLSILPIIAIAIVVTRRRGGNLLEMHPLIAYAVTTGVLLCFVIWIGVSYVELLMSSPRRSLDTPGFFFGYIVAGIALGLLFARRLRRK